VYKQPLPICSCKQCIHLGVDWCKLNGEKIPNQREIPVWCPLADPPSRLIADMETTIRSLRERDTLPFSIGVLSLIATRLGTNIRSDMRGINLELEEGEVVMLEFDSLTIEDAHLGLVRFNYRGTNYRLSLGTDYIQKEVEIPGRGEKGWMHCDLKKK
jgi:hypothetical protein